MMSHLSSPSRQRGVALLIALVLVAMATILASKIGYEGFIERRRTTTMLAAEQAFQFGMGAEALAADVLLRNAQDTKQDTLAEPWAQTPQPIPLRPPNDPEGEPMGILEGSIEDEQGKFNINDLLILGADGKPDPAPLEQFQRLLISLDIEPKWAGLARDWIDADSDPGFPDGAEDAVYSSQTPPYRTGNWKMISITELLSLPGFGADRFHKLAPFITALPEFTPINLCTAPGKVLDSLDPSLHEFGSNPDALVKGRKEGCFPTTDVFMALIPKASADELKLGMRVAENSSYFRLTTRVTLGTTEFTLYSLLRREPNSHRITPILRSFGTI